MAYHRIDLPNPGKLAREAGSILSDAKATRARHRRRSQLDRDDELAGAIEAINAVQETLRSVIAAAAYRPVERADELRGLSRQLQAERRKLRKMLGRSRR